MSIRYKDRIIADAFSYPQQGSSGDSIKIENIDDWTIFYYPNQIVEMCKVWNETITPAEWVEISSGLFYGTGTSHFKAVDLPVAIVEKTLELYSMGPTNWSLICSTQGLSKANQYDPLRKIGDYACYRIGSKPTSDCPVAINVMVRGVLKDNNNNTV